MKLILNTILILLIVSTLSICLIKPDMHKNIIIYNSDYTITPEKQQIVETKEIPVMEKVSTPVKVTTAIPNNTVQKTSANKSTQTKTVTTTAPKTNQNKIKTYSTQQQEQIKRTETKTAEKPIVKTVTQKSAPAKVLTQQEETIAWNIWRSNLQNKIMRDTKLPIMPAGIVFKFSFTVDQYGKVSNVQTWSETPSYTPYAIQYIAPVIRSYQGREILNFPKGTQRTSTNVTGGWRISANEKFSTPHDYNDIEKVVR